ncbi:uncharacterized protein LOC125231166 [Leguminivora glycinivorella]|uniref:uncharacterized protein LOC125231166 n=1 Tax=Leguminivora glycinivorella TaxID=1035111 RepID=UPI00200E376F|nr:uncharacterized protein LOC125231166 [Leguminivora glycinivorella]
MVSKIVLALCVLVAVASAVPAAGGPGGWPAAGGWGAGGWGAPAAPGVGAGGWAPAANPFIPPWIASAPWFPVFSPCAAVGTTCLDCNTKVICTKIGALQRACTDPTLPYCNLGNCTATPSAECAPVAVPAAV